MRNDIAQAQRELMRLSAQLQAAISSQESPEPQPPDEETDSDSFEIEAADVITTTHLDANGNPVKRDRDAATGKFTSSPSSGKKYKVQVEKVKAEYDELFANDSGDNLEWPKTKVQVQDPRTHLIYTEETEKEPPTMGSRYNPEPLTGEALTNWKIDEGAREIDDRGVRWPERRAGLLADDAEPLPWPKKGGEYLKGADLIGWKIEEHKGDPAQLDTSEDGVSWPKHKITGKSLPWPSVRDEEGQKVYLIGKELTRWKKKNGGEISKSAAVTSPNLKRFVNVLAISSDMSAALGTVNVEKGSEDDPATQAMLELRRHLQEEIDLQVAQLALDSLGGDLAGVVLEKTKLEKDIKKLKEKKEADSKDLNKKRAEREERFKENIRKRMETDPMFKFVQPYLGGPGGLGFDITKADPATQEAALDEMAKNAADFEEGLIAIQEAPGMVAHAVKAGFALVFTSPGKWWGTKTPEEREQVKEDIKGALDSGLSAVSGKIKGAAASVGEQIDEAGMTREEAHQRIHEILEKAEQEAEEKQEFLRQAQIETYENDNEAPSNVVQKKVGEGQGKGHTNPVRGFFNMLRGVSSEISSIVVGMISSCGAFKELSSQIQSLMSGSTDIQSEAQPRPIAARTSEARFPHKPLKSFFDIDEWYDDTFLAIAEMDATPVALILLLWDRPDFQKFLKSELERIFPKSSR